MYYKYVFIPRGIDLNSVVERKQGKFSEREGHKNI